MLLRKDPVLWRAALLYYTVHQASRMSFSQLFSNLGRFVQDPNTRWDFCVRAKRGQSDTAQPGEPPHPRGVGFPAAPLTTTGVALQVASVKTRSTWTESCGS